MGEPWKYTKEVLKPVVEQATSVAEVLRLLGVRANGGAHAHISRMIKRYELDTSHFVRYQWVGARGRKKTAAETLVRLPPGSPRPRRPTLRRILIEVGVTYECAWCGIDGTWQGLPLTLEIDHVDADFLNNELSNLRFLCPNCHRQTPNFAGRSRGKFTRAPDPREAN